MKMVNIHQAKTQLSKLIAEVEAGNEVILARAGKPVARIVREDPAFAGPGILVPTRNTDLFRWCLDHGFRLAQQMTLMTIGLYNEPQGAYLPSIMY